MSEDNDILAFYDRLAFNLGTRNEHLVKTDEQRAAAKSDLIRFLKSDEVAEEGIDIYLAQTHRLLRNKRVRAVDPVPEILFASDRMDVLMEDPQDNFYLNFNEFFRYMKQDEIRLIGSYDIHPFHPGLNIDPLIPGRGNVEKIAIAPGGYVPYASSTTR